MANPDHKITSPLISCASLHDVLLSTPPADVGVFQLTLHSIHQQDRPAEDPALIAGARALDLNDLLDNHHLPHSMLEDDVLAERLRINGLAASKVIVLYEQKGVYASPRLWWMLKSIGYKTVYILNATLEQWRACGYPVVPCAQPCGPIDAAAAAGRADGQERNRFAFCQIDFVYRELEKASCQIIDARSAQRFHGLAAEPRAGLSLGHIPGAVNLPFDHLLRQGRYVSEEEIRRIFKSLHLCVTAPVIFMCGSGVTACIVALAAVSFAGIQAPYVYDASWSEWGRCEANHPIATASTHRYHINK